MLSSDEQFRKVYSNRGLQHELRYLAMVTEMRPIEPASNMPNTCKIAGSCKVVSHSRARCRNTEVPVHEMWNEK